MAFSSALLLMMTVFAIPVYADADFGSAEAFYTYNYDNAESATRWGMWGGNAKLDGYVAETTEDVTVRHRMKLCTDDQYVYLQITYAGCFGNPGNGWDYNFNVGGNQAKFTVTYTDGGGLDGTYKEPGSYELLIKHGDGDISGYDAEGAYGHINVNEDQAYNEQEIAIPLKELKRQNPNIDLVGSDSISFFTPNLMTDTISASMHYVDNEAAPEETGGEPEGVPDVELAADVQNEETGGEEGGTGEVYAEPEPEQESEPEPERESEFTEWYVPCDVMGDQAWVKDEISNPAGNSSDEGHQKAKCGVAENNIIRVKDGTAYEMVAINRGGGTETEIYLFTDDTYTEPRDVSTIVPGERIYWETRTGGRVWHHSGTVYGENLPVIIRYVVDDTVEEGTVLREYVDMVDGVKSIIREVSTKSAGGGDDGDADLTDHFDLIDDQTDPPTIDNGKWNDVPAQWEYNWDNTEQATKWGVWGGNGHLENYITDHMDDINVRHHMGIYCDGESVHLFIEYASCFDNPGNGNDYNFYLDGTGTKFRVTFEDGSDLSQTYREPGEYKLLITHGDGAISGQEVEGAYGTIIIKEGQLNNMQEIVIPLEEMKRQNDSVNLDTLSMIEFFTPNLMYRHIACAGASSGPVVFIIISAVIFGAYLLIDSKRRLKHFVPGNMETAEAV